MRTAFCFFPIAQNRFWSAYLRPKSLSFVALRKITNAFDRTVMCWETGVKRRGYGRTPSCARFMHCATLSIITNTKKSFDYQVNSVQWFEAFAPINRMVIWAGQHKWLWDKKSLASSPAAALLHTTFTFASGQSTLGRVGVVAKHYIICDQS